MKINNKEFNKLSQLDRIEFRQKYIEIGDINIDSSKFALSIGTFLMLFSISAYIIETNDYFLNMIIFSLKLSFLMLFLYFIIDMIYNIIILKERRELYKEYFDFKIDVKKKK
ncbi:MAG: hypothetical protein WC758_08220 [Candidatus Woesearchaeota archaeon]|jgi:hypothetical protein